MFCLAISILLLAETAPSSLPTTARDTGSVVRSAETAPAPTTALTTEGSGTLILPTTKPTQPSVVIAPETGSPVKVTFTGVDATARMVSVKVADTGKDETYAVPADTPITLDGKSIGSDLGLLASAGSATGMITTSGKAVTSIAAESAPWWSKIGSTSPIVLMIPVLLLFLFVSMRNKRKQEKAQQEKLGSIKRGDRIQTIGGIIGNVVQTEEARVLVKVDESNNTKIWFARSAVGRVLGEEKSSDSKTTK